MELITEGHLRDVLSVWGALVATILASIKIFEFVSDKPRLSTDYGFSSAPVRGNEIVLINTARTPALINYWELTWARRWWLWTRFERFEAMPEEGRCDLTILGHGRVTLSFVENRWFKTTPSIEGQPVALYIKLYLAGRRQPTWLQVWKPD